MGFSSLFSPLRLPLALPLLLLLLLMTLCGPVPSMASPSGSGDAGGSHSGSSIEEVLSRVESLHLQGEYEDAALLLGEALQEDDGASLPDYLDRLVYCYYLAKEFEVALDLIHLAIDQSLDQLLPTMYYYQGKMYLDSSSYLEALESFNSALKINPGHQSALYSKAALLYRFKHLIQVENYDGELNYQKYYRKARIQVPESADDWENRGVMELFLGKHEAAIESASHALKALPKRGVNLVTRCNAYVSLSDFPSALRDALAMKELALDQKDRAGVAALLQLIKQELEEHEAEKETSPPIPTSSSGADDEEEDDIVEL